ncbi:MAG: hypothetical protein RIC80_05300 [Cyclobacteriaceae bacterium]
MRVLTLSGVVWLLFWLCHSSYAQEDRTPGQQVVIDYADGSLFQGTIVSATQNQLQMKLSTGDTINLNISMIDKMVNSSNHLIKRRGKFHYRSGYFGYTSIAGGSSNIDGSFQFDLMAGYRLDERLSLGLGFAADIHDLTLGNSWTTLNFNPVYGYGRYYLNDKTWRLYADSKLGYAFANDTDFSEGHKGGLYFQPGLGFHIATKGKFKPHLSLSYLLLNAQGTSVDFSPWFGGQVTHDFNVWYSRVMFRVAVEFK